MVLENNHLTVKTVGFHYSKPSIDTIGYDNIQTAICVPRSYFISAHAPSKLLINFKNSGKIYVNCNVNRTTGIINDTIQFFIKCGKVTLHNSEASLEYKSIDVIKGVDYIFEIKAQNSYGAHTIWSFFHPNETLSFIDKKALEDANKINLDMSSDYSLFVQTCNPRKIMAFRCIVSFLNNVSKLPKRIIVCSLDDVNSDGIFPHCVDFLCGKKNIFNKLLATGLTTECIEFIFNGFKSSGNPNMWLKYVIPRLCMGNEKILVMDDDVAVLGKCDKLLSSNSYLTFMNDSGAFYGNRTIKFFNEYYNTDKFASNKPPYICAGVYMLNNEKREHSVKFINDLILFSHTDQDEQAAVGMELIDSNDYTILEPPEYHHGGWANQDVDFDKLNLMHMQGRAVKYREDFIFTKLFMTKRLN